MAAAGGISQGAYGFVKANGTVILVRPGAGVVQPLNPDIPHPINGDGIGGAINWAEGFQFPVVNVPAIPMDDGAGAAGWLTAANLNSWFVTRSAIPVGDLTELTTLYLSDNGSYGNGIGSWRVNKPKGAGFSLVARKGQGIGLNLRFAGRSRVKGLVGDRPATPLQGTPLMFDRLMLGTELDGHGIIGITLNYDTGLTPNMELDGTLYPVEQNAGLPSATLTIEYNALDTIAPLGYDAANDTWQAVTDVDFTLRAARAVGMGSPLDITFNIARLQVRNPYDIQTQQNRVQRTRTYDCLASGSQASIVTIA